MSATKRRKALKRVRAGDGRPLPDYDWWHWLWRSLFIVRHAGADGQTHEYAIDVNFFDFDGKAELYRDGVQHAVASMPAAFPVPGGVIEVAASTLGMKRVHLVLDSGKERQLRPAPGTAEHWRARLDRNHPRLSRWLAGLAIAVLLIGLVLLVPQLVQEITTIPAIANLLGTFNSPISLPAWLNTALGIAGAAASMERALTLRNHWLIDADTWLFDG